MENMPKFAPARNRPVPDSYDTVDLDYLFAEHFFPADLDFSAFLQSEESEDVSNGIASQYFQYDRNNELSNEQSCSDGHFQQPSPNYTSDMSSSVPASALQFMGGFESRDYNGGNNNGGNQSEVIMIPPSIPNSAALYTNKAKVKKEGASTKTLGDILSQSKYNNKAGKVKAPARVKEEIEDDDDDFDDDDDDGLVTKMSGKKRKGIVKEIDPQELTEQQKIERRERNREHAKRSRIRKKVLLDTLQDQLAVLRNENTKLRRLVADRLPTIATSLLNECTTEESLLLASDTSVSFSQKFDSIDGLPRTGFSPKTFEPRQQYCKVLMEPDFRLIQALIHSQQNFVLSDPSLLDNPIVYASDGFCKLSGYKKRDILGRNCRFLQGPGTDQGAVTAIRKGVAEGKDISVCLLNYKADGTPFWNQFFVAALRDSDGQIVNYVGIQCAVNTLPIAEIKDRVKKLPMPANY